MYLVESVMKASAIGTRRTDTAILRPTLRFLACMSLVTVRVSAPVLCVAVHADAPGSRASRHKDVESVLRVEGDEDEEDEGEDGRA